MTRYFMFFRAYLSKNVDNRNQIFRDKIDRGMSLFVYRKFQNSNK